MVLDLLLGACAGGVAGAIGACAAAGLQHGAKIVRNRALVARDIPGFKDVAYRPPWLLLGLVGALAGAIAVAVGGSLRTAALVGAAPCVLLALTSLAILWEARSEPLP